MDEYIDALVTQRACVSLLFVNGLTRSIGAATAHARFGANISRAISLSKNDRRRRRRRAMKKATSAITGVLCSIARVKTHKCSRLSCAGVHRMPRKRLYRAETFDVSSIRF